METSNNSVLNPERLKALEIWLKETNMKLTQVNGQRKYGGPPDDWQGPLPGVGCEVFISQIPRDVYEDLLIPLFSSAGALWEFRLMMNFSGQNRGFAYAKYGTAAVAADAIRLLNGHMLQPGVHLSVRRSIEKRHLCLEELPLGTKRKDLLQVLRGLTEGVDGVILKAGPGIEGMSALVVYSSHYAASMAKKVLVEAFQRHFAMAISVKWQSSSKTKSEEPAVPQKTSKKPRAAKATCYNSPYAPLLHPGLIQATAITQGFSRAVGGPTPLLPLCPPSMSPQAHAESPVSLLQKVCEASWGGQPLYELKYCHSASDGFLYFSYSVRVPGLVMPFCGLVTTLPGHSAAATLEEARQGAAKQVLQLLHGLTS